MAGSLDKNQYRRGVGCYGLFGTTGSYYEAQPIVNTMPFPVVVRAFASFQPGKDGYMHLYDYPFDPTDVGTNCLVGDDGWEHLQLIDNIVIQPNEMKVLVLSSWSANDPIGAYELQIETYDVCGDGIQGATEQCDDGNDLSGDGCDSTCSLELGYTCAFPGQACELNICGDGFVGGGEGCDDGNDTPGDGCDAACQVEPDWACPTPGNACRPITCGDGFLDFPETCDDGNTASGDGCDGTCQIEFLDPQGADAGFHPGFGTTVGSWVQSSYQPGGMPYLGYNFSANVGTTYVIDLFVGEPYACVVGNGTSTNTRLLLETMMLEKLAASFFYRPQGCSHIEWTAPASDTYHLTFLGFSETFDPLYLWVREAP
jgi:cysteine-rich repeat protein